MLSDNAKATPVSYRTMLPCYRGDLDRGKAPTATSLSLKNVKNPTTTTIIIRKS